VAAGVLPDEEPVAGVLAEEDSVVELPAVIAAPLPPLSGAQFTYTCQLGPCMAIQ